MADRQRQPSRLRALIRGHVHMVGFRAFAETRAQIHAVTGYVRNLPTGEVEVVAEGDKDLLDSLLADLRRGPRGAVVTDVLVSWEQPRNEFTDFSVRY